MKKSILLFLSLGLALSSAGCPARVKLDNSAYAFMANDYTSFLESRGQCVTPPEVGFTYCRIASGSATKDTSIIMHFPPVICNKKDAAGNDRIGCISTTVFFQDGGSPYGFVVPFGITEVALPWDVLLKKPLFEKGDRGFYGISSTITFIGEDKFEHDTLVRGEMRLRVYEPLVDGKSYIPLHNAKEDAAFVWKWTDKGGRSFRMSTAGRASVF